MLLKIGRAISERDLADAIREAPEPARLTVSCPTLEGCEKAVGLGVSFMSEGTLTPLQVRSLISSLDATATLLWRLHRSLSGQMCRAGEGCLFCILSFTILYLIVRSFRSKI